MREEDKEKIQPKSDKKTSEDTQKQRPEQRIPQKLDKRDAQTKEDKKKGDKPKQEEKKKTKNEEEEHKKERKENDPVNRRLGDQRGTLAKTSAIMELRHIKETSLPIIVTKPEIVAKGVQTGARVEKDHIRQCTFRKLSRLM